MVEILQCMRSNLLQTHSSVYFIVTGRAYLGEVLNQEISELLDKQVNAQKEKNFGVHTSSPKQENKQHAYVHKNAVGHL